MIAGAWAWGVQGVMLIRLNESADPKECREWEFLP